MSALLNRLLIAYRPLQLRGLLLDGQYRLPPAAPPEAATPTADSPRRLSLAALTGLRQWPFLPRGKP
jgi:hypothetical protein